MDLLAGEEFLFTSWDGRPRVDDLNPGRDKLLENLRDQFGEPRFDIPTKAEALLISGGAQA